MKTLIAALLLAVMPMSFVGCATTTKTKEAVVFDSFKSTYNAAYTAYTSYLELVVRGKVSRDQEVRADAAWNHFRAGFSVAFRAASQDWNAAAPDQVKALADKLITIIRAL